MRYFAGLIGGTIVAVFLFAFQQHLIAGERELVLIETIKPTLPTMPESLPPETKPYVSQELPPKPEPLVKPETSVDPSPPQNTFPVLVDLPSFEVDGHHGAVPEIYHGGQRVTDGSAVLTMPVRPVYPPRAAQEGIEGEVEVEFTVLANGSVADIVILRAEPPGVFEQSARRALQRWGFKPKRENGQPVPMRVRQVIRFELPEQL